MAGKRRYPILGSHVSAAGGVSKAIERALEVGCDCLQIFTKNNNQWQAKPLKKSEINDWIEGLAESGLQNPIAHASYLINLASPRADLFRKSVNAMVVELRRANQLQLEGLVVHPGSYMDSSEDDGLDRIVDGINATLDRVEDTTCRLLLENTAGQGTNLGYDLNQLAYLLDSVDQPDRLGICIDTCHAFAAGYAIHTQAGFKKFKKQIGDLFPSDGIQALHLNDSKKPLGSRVDRHEHIGKGEIGLDGFRFFLRDAKFRKIPGYLETKKEVDPKSGEHWDVINLRTLRSLV